MVSQFLWNYWLIGGVWVEHVRVRVQVDGEEVTLMFVFSRVLLVGKEVTLAFLFSEMQVVEEEEVTQVSVFSRVLLVGEEVTVAFVFSEIQVVGEEVPLVGEEKVTQVSVFPALQVPLLVKVTAWITVAQRVLFLLWVVGVCPDDWHTP